MQYEKITSDEGIAYSRNIRTSRFCNVCKFWYFLDKNFNYEDYACNGCHNLLMMAYSLDNIVILPVNVSFRCILLGISRNECLWRLHANSDDLGKKGAV